MVYFEVCVALEKDLKNDFLFEKLFSNYEKIRVLFKDERFLNVDHIPTRILHRDSELYQLMIIYGSLLTYQGSNSINQIVCGKSGVGKTATVRYFASELEKKAIQMGFNLRYIHIDCRKECTGHKVLTKIARTLNRNIAKRGYSPQDLLDFIYDCLRKRGKYLLLVLDNFDYLLEKEDNNTYCIVRINDNYNETVLRISIIGILRALNINSKIFRKIQPYFKKSQIGFRKYTEDQIFDILKERVKLSVYDNVIVDSTIEKVSKKIVKKGDIRNGLNLLWSAIKIAENKELKYVTDECVELAYKELFPFSIHDTIRNMSEHKLLTLLCITKELQTNNKPTSLSAILERYNLICARLRIEPRTYSQLYNYLKEYNNEKIVELKVQSEGIKGRKSIIKIPDTPLLQIQENIVSILNSKGILLES